ncbi:sulfatase [Actinacidiphila oryziradicis]|uniref:Sulfatase n=1 Tax=Actinacidiphila oryziradicis TaxID=2571141 RepID=A0A4U0SI51_9ACTN|nr:sulfatase [Actinacidiphila oryziradicis]
MPKTDETNTQEGPTADALPQYTPDDTAEGQNTVTSDGSGVPQDATAGATTGDHPDDTDGVRDDDAGEEPGNHLPGNHLEADVEGGATASDGKAARADTAAGDATSDATSDEPPGQPATGGGWRDKHPGAARAVSSGTTTLATVLVLFALLMPNRLELLTLSRFIRIPVEGILVAALLLILPPRPRRVVAVVSGLILGLLTILNCVDMGFYSVLSRPFDPVLDWTLFGDGESFLKDSIGQAGTIGAVIGLAVLVIAVLVLMVLTVVRLSNLMVRHRATATRTTVMFGTVWMTCATLGVQFFAGMPIASRSATQRVQDRADRVSTTLKDEKVFAKQAAHDAFAKTPASQLLTGLRGKDVIFTFIESYGRSAVEDPAMAPGVDAVLTKQTTALKKAGFATRSGWLTSPVTGAGSWLAHTTFLSGLWVQNQQRYRNVTSSNRLTLTSAFKQTGAWQTVGMMPGVTRAWPEGKFFGLNKVYDSRNMGYTGPKFSWSPVPDQYTLKAFEQLSYGKKNRGPLMAEIVLATSHNPWSPLPYTIGWNQVGNGSVYTAQKKQGTDPEQVWKSAASVRHEYGKAIQYSVTNLTDFMMKYANKNTVLVFLGDHQPVTTVTGSITASRDVPVAIVAHDKSVLDKISSWGWTDSLQPAHNAPVWRMDTFRNRFLTAYGPQAASTPSASPSTSASVSPSTSSSVKSK